MHALAERLRGGDLSAEPPFLAAFDRLADRLLLDDPRKLSALVAEARALPLALPASQQLVRFYEGLALSKAEHFAESLAVFDALLAEPDLDAAVRGRALNSRANSYRILGRLEDALAGFLASLTLWRRLGNRLREGLALLNLGIAAYQLQRYDEAEDGLRQAVLCFTEAGARQWLAAAQNELGLIYRDLGRWPEALACLNAAAECYRLESSQDALGRVLNNIGEVLLLQGDNPQALAAFAQALAAMRTRLYAVDVYLNIGLAHQAAGDLTAARAACEQALALALAIDRRDTLAQVHFRLGEALRLLGEDARALDHFVLAAEIVEAQRQPIRDEGLKISLLGSWQQIFEGLVLHCLALGRVAAAFNWAERARARAFADAVARQASADGQGPLDPAATAEQARVALPPDTTVLCYLTTGVQEREQPLLQALPGDSALRRHLSAPARTLLFLLTPTGLAVHPCSLDPNALVSASPRQEDRGRYFEPSVLRRLHAALLTPAAEALASQRLIVVPHGPLHRVPFAALRDDHGQPLVRASGPSLTYAPSVSVLLQRWSAPATAAARSCLAVGYDGAREGRALRHSEAEARLVASLTGGEAWVGPQSKKEMLRQAASECRWLHIACHGQFDEDDPLASYLETGAGERLTAREVLQDWRLRAELVALSACQSGVSRIVRGDEPLGLVRAFLYAGAQAVLVSQWPVEDLPTALLMQRFYRELQGAAEADPARALHGAQTWLRELATAQSGALFAGAPDTPADLLAELPADSHPFGHPRYWAGFVLIQRLATGEA